MTVVAFVPRHETPGRVAGPAEVLRFAPPPSRAREALAELRAVRKRQQGLQQAGMTGRAFRAFLGRFEAEASVRTALAHLPWEAALRLYCEAFPEDCPKAASAHLRAIRRVA